MSPVTLPKSTMDYTIDLLVVMTVVEIVRQTGKSAGDVLTDFLCSKTGELLYDVDARLWHNGPVYLAELYLEETKNRGGSSNIFC